MFSLRIYGNILLHHGQWAAYIILKVVESVKFITIKSARETKGPGFDEKFLPGGGNLTKLELNLRQGCGGM